jgi:hypothetical protein
MPCCRFLLLVLLVAHGGAAPLAAQRSAEDTRIIDGYRLTMPVLRKVLPALTAAPAGCKAAEVRDVQTLSITQMTRMLDECYPVSQALHGAGVSARDAAIVYGSMMRTAQAVALQGGKASALPAGPLRDNALLMERNDGELRRLSRNGGQS